MTGANAGCAPQDGDTPLLIAAHQGNMAVAQMLLQAMADKEAKNKVRVSCSGSGMEEQSFEQFLDVSRGLAIRQNFCAPA